MKALVFVPIASTFHVNSCMSMFSLAGSPAGNGVLV